MIWDKQREEMHGHKLTGWDIRPEHDVQTDIHPDIVQMYMQGGELVY